VWSRGGDGGFKGVEELGKGGGVDVAALEARRLFFDY